MVETAGMKSSENWSEPPRRPVSHPHSQPGSAVYRTEFSFLLRAET